MERATTITQRHQQEIDETRATVQRLTDPSKRKAGDNGKELTKLRDRMLRLCAPTNEIYYQQLIPRLEKLPTRQQRAAAAARDAKK